MAVITRTRADGTKTYSVRIWRNGKHEWIDTFETRREAKEVERRELAANVTDHKETIGEFAVRWVKEYPRPKRTTRKQYERVANRIAAEDFGKIKLNKLTRPQARAYAVANPYMRGPLSSMYSDAMNDGLVNDNPFANLRLPQSRGRKDIVPLTEEEVIRLAGTALKVHEEPFASRFRAMIIFAAHSGARPGELGALEWPDIDWITGTAHIRRRIYDGDVDVPKSGETRLVVLSPSAIEALRTIPRSPGQRLVFTTKTGTQLLRGPGAYWRPVWQRFLGETKSPRKEELENSDGAGDFHALRHFCATMLLERGLPVEDVAIHLGHTDGGVQVRSRYGHPSEDASRERIRDAFAIQRPVTPLRPVHDAEEAV